MKDFKLDNEPKISSGFTVPDGYFDTFPARLLTPSPTPETKVISIFKSGKSWYFAAAAVLFILLSVPLWYTYNANTEKVETAALEDYLANQSSISEDEIVNLLDKEDLEKMKVDFKLEDKAIEEVLEANANLEQYILD